MRDSMFCMKRRIRRSIALLAVGVALAAPMTGYAQGGDRRPPALEQQLRRAAAAWRSGASLLEAKARLDRVLQRRPDDLKARILRSEVLLDMNRPEEALIDARYAVGLAAAGGKAWVLLTEAARRSSKLDLARRTLKRAIPHLCSEVDSYVRLSWNATLLGELSRAESLARSAMELDENAPAVYYQLARVLVQQDRREAAVNVLARGFEEGLLNPAFIRRGRLLRSMAGHPALQPFMDGRGSRR